MLHLICTAAGVYGIVSLLMLLCEQSPEYRRQEAYRRSIGYYDKPTHSLESARQPSDQSYYQQARTLYSQGRRLARRARAVCRCCFR